MESILAQGAEAIIYSDNHTVTKDRPEKTYRHPKIDRKLRKSRTRRESKILEKLQAADIPAPHLISMDDKEMKVYMDHIPGKMVKEVIDVLENEKDCVKYTKLCKEIGIKVAAMHNIGIVHHDLTTSNMILHDVEDAVYIIDFGLSFFSDKTEDYAVDLHLLRHALESRHHRIFEKCFEAVVEGYKEKAERADETLKRLETVELRGRNKGKYSSA
ncbi:Kae1-associated serine/threonine protein kinase [Candidatus Woesearchaeota archaeon]|nr:Kae1-associated serine/threonine protein kinase [Candidatus Woesearchaeota archaeon]